MSKLEEKERDNEYKLARKRKRHKTDKGRKESEV